MSFTPSNAFSEKTSVIHSIINNSTGTYVAINIIFPVMQITLDFHMGLLSSIWNMDLFRLATRVAAAVGGVVTLTMTKSTVDTSGNPIARWRLDAEGKSLVFSSISSTVVGPDSDVDVDGNKIQAKKLIEAATKSADFGLSGETVVIDEEWLLEAGLKL